MTPPYEVRRITGGAAVARADAQWASLRARGIVRCAAGELIGRRGQDRSPTGCGGERRAIKTLPYSCGSQDRTTPQSAALTAPL